MTKKFSNTINIGKLKKLTRSKMPEYRELYNNVMDELKEKGIKVCRSMHDDPNTGYNILKAINGIKEKNNLLETLPLDSQNNE